MISAVSLIAVLQVATHHIGQTVSLPRDGLRNVVAGRHKDYEDSVLAEGDMLLTEEQYQTLYLSEDSGLAGRRAKRGFTPLESRFRWTDAVMPYEIIPAGFSPTNQYNIHRAMTEWERYTCVKWRPKTGDDKYWIKIVGYSGCLSQIGNAKKKDGQKLYLGPSCRSDLSRPLHEMGHSIGLLHEHTRPDRDDHVKIHDERTKYNAYKKRMRNDKQFGRLGGMGTPYDIKSIMQYAAYDNPVGDLPAITAVNPSENKWIHFNLTDWGRALSFYDVKIVNLMYNCSDHCPDKDRCTGEGFLDQNCNCVCPDGSTDCDRSEQPERSVCANKFFDDWRCKYWANQGECERNAKWMGFNCAKACGLCRPKHKTGSKAPQRCRNVFSTQKCEDWKWRGECVRNREWMRRNCRETCDLCRDDKNRPEANCENKHQVSTLCDDFALDGDCLLKPVAMHTNCRRSCFQCHLQLEDIDRSWSEVNDTIQEESAPCVDIPECEWLAKGTGCDRFSDRCVKSCGKCEDGTCKNTNSDADCMYRESRLECVGNSVWMAKNCALACGRRECTGLPPTAQPSTTARPTARPTTATSGCHNINDGECDYRAAEGLCETHRRTMEHYCPKSCNFCH